MNMICCDTLFSVIHHSVSFLNVQQKHDHGHMVRLYLTSKTKETKALNYEERKAKTFAGASCTNLCNGPKSNGLPLLRISVISSQV